LNLFEQFQRLANAYFLVLLVLQFIPQISSLVWYTTVIPLVLVLSISGVKDAIDDLVRKFIMLVSKCFSCRLKEDIWMNVQVGDIIKLEKDHFVTADVLLLSSSEPHSLAYIETAELDGETNLKVKQALTVTSEMGDNLERLAAFDGEVRCEPPNNKLDKFTGTLIHKEEKHALDNEKMLLRGCTIRNTEWCYGLVIFAGPDTKLMQNSGKATFKRTSIDHLMNVLVFSIFLFLAAMCLILAIGNGIWEKRRGFYFQIYLPWAEEVNSATLSALLIFWSYVIILNTVVPISLYVSVEIIRLGNSFYIDWDRKMYYSVNNTPAQARTTTLNEELGQIKYVFSDKTGTLTQNIMAFNKCSINGKSYGTQNHFETETVDFSYNELADPKFAFYDHSLVEAVKLGDTAVHQFFLSLSLCHTVMSEEKEEGNLVYQAQSPDEGALVTAARNFGFVFRSRTPETITVVEMGETRVYQLLAILDFTNVRKRMSVIGGCLYSLLAFAYLGHTCVFQEFAGEGLRTLVVAYRQLDESYFNTWITRHHEASTALEEREEKLAMLYQEIESNLMLLGATAIEDKLQDGVPETIETLTRAKINVWVLTGDKQGKLGLDSGALLPSGFLGTGCLLSTTCYYIIITIMAFIKCLLSAGVEPGGRNRVIPLTSLSRSRFLLPGDLQAFALEAKLELELLRAACMCKAVICCRVTPLQKAQVVELVKRHKNAVTLAIGDGANDVSMIKTAHIGVGISGQEGMQAVLSSDFSFAQFRFLQRLLLVHGRWSYIRMCKFLRYFFYKNFAFTLVHFWYGFFSGFSAQTVYDEWFITLYNLVYTSLPVLGMSLFDQDVNDYWSLRFPELYEPGQHNLYFNKREFIKCMVHGIYSSLILFFVPFGTVFNSVRSDGKTISDYQSFALMAQTSLLMVVSVQIGLDTAYWTAVNQFFIWGSLAVYFAITFTMYSDGMYLIFTSSFRFIGTARNTLNQPEVWLSIFLSVILCMLPIAGYRFLKAELKPTTNDKKPLPPPPKARLRRTSSRRSGYAFSHQHGFGALITSGRNMRAKSPFATTGTYSPNK
uniref:Phospholipid-transporting ATPase n=1 Tax=Ornithorhynchus anatinus TaxID=9258 RepID=F7D760_ORNAN